MKITLLLLTAFMSTLSLAQKNENDTKCYKRDGFSPNQLKSNSLNVAQIAETERYDVHYYSLDVAMDNLSTDIAGTGEIHGTARETLDSVLFELFETFNISEIRLNGTPTVYSWVGSAIKVPVNINQGDPFIIAVDYSGTPPTAATNPLGGAGMSNSSSPTWGNQVTWSLSEPFSAYEWWPCKQSLSDKADSCAVKITVPNACKAGSNGVLDAIVDLGNGTSRYEWKHNHAIDYYLISIAIAHYVEYNIFANPLGSAGPVLIQNYIYDNPATLPNFQSDIDETVDFIELFATLFGPYPFQDEKYGHCMAPIGGGMEHQTMTTQGFFNKGLTSHELGHMWWGDHITCASWADIWVNEGFASYSMYLMLENLYPVEAAPEMLNIHDNVMSNPNGSVWVLDSLNESRIFSGRLTYDKGAAIIHTFRFMIDNDVEFFQALKNIQTDFGDSTVFGLDVRDYLGAASGIDFTVPFQEWYFGEGYPTYSASWNTNGSDLHLELTHTTSSTTPTFTNPIELQFSRLAAADTTIRVDVSSNLDQYVIAGMGDVTGLLKIDPKNWIINKVGSIAHDVNLFVGITEQLSNEYYTISPNPSEGKFIIETSNSEKNTIVVYDNRGREIQSLDFENSLELDLTKENAGSYILQLIDDKGDKRVRTVVKN